MAGTTHRWLARIVGAAAAALMIAGTTTGTASAATTVVGPPPVEVTSNFGVVATTHPDTVGCNGYKVTGTGTSIGSPFADGGVWTQDEVVCTATVPGTYDINGTAMISRSNGDKLKISYHLSAPLTSATTVYPTGTFTILRGEGLYEDATGGGSMSATVNLLDHAHVTSQMSGYMRFLWQV
ncbi:hypothetical protein ABT154_27115 [Streptomyces sp. NPDC001728]|uniref:hypothetical protein n=1 Tax=Streptomyces sp. NPDC001728 TaxID=3154396 RepID=UPI0033315751